MTRVIRFLSFGLLALVGVCAVGVGYLALGYPDVSIPRIARIEPDAAMEARGAYLAEHVAICVDCHSERDYARFSAPPKPGTFGKGGERFGRELGLPGTLVAPNITPHALASWSDGELVRALTSGVTKDGRALFPLMNYPGYATLCRSDLEALVTYLRRLPPVAHTPAETELDFPVNLIVRTLPKAAQIPERCPDRADSVAYGRYLVGIAGCADCHTPRKGADPIPELAFSGGTPMPLPNGQRVVTRNITPHETGIGSWTREAFVARFATYRDPASVHAVGPSDYNTPMPWSMYAGMSDEDLGAIYDFLRTLAPVKSAAPFAAR